MMEMEGRKVKKSLPRRREGEGDAERKQRPPVLAYYSLY